MAVYNPDQVNLAPNYANIINALKSQTEIAANAPPSPLAMLAKVAGQGAGAYVGQKVANKLDADQQKKLGEMRFAIEDELSKNRTKYAAQAAGKRLYKQPDVNEQWVQLGGTPETSPNVGADGIYLDEKDLDELYSVGQKRVRHNEFTSEIKRYADQYNGSKDPEDKKRGQLLDMLSKLPDDKMASITDDLRKIILPEPESMTRGGATLTPVKRQEALRNEFAKKVKEIGFRKYADAYTVAQSTEKKVSKNEINSASDARLLYSWAKMLNPVGVLSDQDFRTAVEIGSYGEQVKKALNKINEGNVMDGNLRNKIILEIKSSYDQADSNLSQIEDEHRALADSEGLDYERTISPVRPKIKEDKESSPTTIKTVIQNGKQYRIEVDENGKFIREAK